MKFRFVRDLTSDVVFEAFGKDKKELFENAALAMFSVICQIRRVEPLMRKDVSVEGENLKDLMFNWLQALIGMVDVENVFLSKFQVTEMDDNHIKAFVYGEDADPGKGETVVKGVTYYKFGVEKTDDGYKATVSLDI
jgi:SHS2 domain-containing protein